MKDYLIGSDICAADPRPVVAIYRADEVLGAVDPVAAQIKAQDKKDSEKIDITLGALGGGLVLGAVAGALLMKSKVLGVVLGGVTGALLSGVGAAALAQKEVK